MRISSSRCSECASAATFLGKEFSLLRRVRRADREWQFARGERWISVQRNGAGQNHHHASDHFGQSAERREKSKRKLCVAHREMVDKVRLDYSKCDESNPEPERIEYREE